MLNLYKTHLHILQLEEYSPLRFLNWWFRHPFTASISNKKPLVYTQKIRHLILLSHISLIILLILFARFQILDSIFLLFYLLSPFVYLFLAILAYKPHELINRQLTINKVRKQILTHPHLTTIGITGSYGKTGTKNFLFDILNNFLPSLKTPESYNTVFGIAKTINLELTDNLHYFISEMGAYKIGEINELCRMTPPNYAILTAIGTQHLERFKNLKNTTEAKFELINHTPPSHALVNLDNPYIAANLSKYNRLKTYSLADPKADFFVSKLLITPIGINFTLNNHAFETPLFGTSNLSNLAAAISMAMMLKIPLQLIKESVAKMNPAPHRLELKKIGQATLIDNAYSSNEKGFKNIMADLKRLKGKKALITPGIVELGGETACIHRELGKLAATVFDTIILEGHNIRTDNFAIGVRHCERSLAKGGRSMAIHTNISFLNSSSSLWPTIDRLAETHSWILLENDLPDNY